MAELDDIITLSSFFSNAITMPLIDTISSTMTSPEDEFTVRILGHCMEAVAKRETSEWSSKINIPLWTKRCTGKWSGSYEVLEGLVALAQARWVVYIVKHGEKI